MTDCFLPPHATAYLVGGAVRDKLLGLPVEDKDWVVVGCTPQEMLDRGFIEVGHDFPVYLHPTTKEEFALARTERKSGKGYKGFRCDFGAHVTLEQDLQRRDLTINAIAEDATGKLIDPYGGLNDIKTKTFRHVSDAFVEDPLRVLRVARLMARFAATGFRIAPTTLQLMSTIVTNDEMEHLTPERVWQELEKAFAADQPWQLLLTLEACGALARVFPRWHAQISSADSKEKTFNTLKRASDSTASVRIRFASLFAPELTENIPDSASDIATFCRHIKAPNAYSELATLVGSQASLLPSLQQREPKALLLALKQLDAFRKPERIHDYLIAYTASNTTLSNDERDRYGRLINTIINQCLTIDARKFLEQGLTGKHVGSAIDEERELIIQDLLDA